MAIPSLLKAYALFVDGRGYAGKADIELPTLSITTEEYAAGGMAGKIKVDMGLVEAIDLKFTLYEYDKDLIKLWGLVDGSAVRITARGAEQSDDGQATKPIRVEVEGQFHELGMGSWEAGSKASMECTVNARNYKLIVDGETVVEIDAERMVRKIGGTDQMQALRGAIGV